MRSIISQGGRIPESAIDRKAREARKGTLCIQDSGGEMPGRAIWNNSVRTHFRLDERWRLYAIFAGLAVRILADG
jgi:hypothetical protein